MAIDTNTFEFLISDEDEIMLLLYARDIAPEQPAVRLSPEDKTIELYRRVDDAFTLEKVEDEVFELLKDAETLLVCEILPMEETEETEIVYTYNATIIE
ncbi:MAG: hypothetical protein IKR92_06560 [Alphaproteobacteria bacterium]|nr:hypothetical protein [Alphaproteobacteria bacterium]